MDKIKIPQVLVSYAGGSGGEWLAYQIAQHDKYLTNESDELELEINEFNRCRITPSWRGELLDEGLPQRLLWSEKEYTNTEQWWEHFNRNAPQDKTEFYEIIKDLTERKPRYRIPVHRCHEAWYDSYFADMFEDFRIVTLYVNKEDERTFRQFQSNIIKKIWWQDLSDRDDLIDELEDKFRKFYKRFKRPKGSYHDVLKIIDKWDGDINYTDMMLAMNYHHFVDETEAREHVLQDLHQRWNRYNVEQHRRDIPVDHHIILDFGKMFVYKEYDEYKRMCDFLETTPWTPEKWSEVSDPYTKVDFDAYITVEDVEKRIDERLAKL